MEFFLKDIVITQEVIQMIESELGHAQCFTLEEVYVKMGKLKEKINAKNK
jgi:hypothetical protein